MVIHREVAQSWKVTTFEDEGTQTELCVMQRHGIDYVRVYLSRQGSGIVVRIPTNQWTELLAELVQ